jgi:glutamyl-tRNA reductase
VTVHVFPVPLAALVLHQRSAPIDARERLLELVVPWRELPDRVVLATCHRVEIYLSGVEAQGADAIAEELDARGGGLLRRSLVRFDGAAAAAHLFEVAVGLDSAVQGEPQIGGQVRAVLASAPASLDPILRRLLERALGLGRSLRRRTALAGIGRSVGSLAVDEVVRLLAQPDRATVLVVGAGEMGALAVRALTRRVARVVVANRDRARADIVARSVGAEAIGLADIASRLDDVDAIVSAADTRGSVLSEAILAKRVVRGPLALVDIAVPRSVGPAARALTGLTYRTVDDLAGAQALSPDEAERVRLACAGEADRFAREVRERAAAWAIKGVRAHADAMRLRHLDRALRRLRHLSSRDRRVVEALSARVVNSLLHEPTIVLKKEPDRSEHALALFGLGREPR